MQLLDFTDSIDNEHFLVFKEYESKEICVLSKSLQIYNHTSGKPAFLFEIVRGVTPFSKPAPYALLEMQLEPLNLAESILNDISEKWPEHPVKFVDINSGFLILTLYNKVDNDQNSGNELSVPIPLIKIPLSRLIIVEKFDIESINLFLSVFEEGILLMNAKGWYSVYGYAPLVETFVKFNPAELTNSIKSFISSNEGYINYNDLFYLFRDKINLLPILTTRNETGDSFVSSLSDRYLEYFCEPMPLLNKDNEINFKFNELSTKEGEFTWDLHKPQIVKRYIYYYLQGLESMIKMIQEGNFPEYTQTRIVESLPTGFTPISVYHPFFILPVGIRQIGIKISASPVDNHRFQAINETITFDSGTVKKTAILKFSPHEKMEFNVLPFAIIEENGISKEIYGENFISSNKILFIQENLFPLSFITFKCTEALMDSALIRLEIISEFEKDPYPPTIFSKENSSIMYAFSKGHIEELRANIIAIDSNNISVSKSFSLHNDLKIDFTSFDSFGSHAVNIKLKPGHDELVAIELLPEYLEELNENISTLALSKAKPEQNWYWYTPSLFKSGFRYRLPLTETEWSEVLSYNINELIIP